MNDIVPAKEKTNVPAAKENEIIVDGRQRTSLIGLYLLQQREGCELTAYRCQAGILTIGYGHTANVHEGDHITQEQAEQLLRSDVCQAENCLNRMKLKYGIRFNIHEFDALVSFIFNIGVAAFEKSTMYKKLAAGEPKGVIAGEFAKWVMVTVVVNGIKTKKQSAGLTNRRRSEISQFLDMDDLYKNATTIHSIDY